jgi:histidine triad (HIT) family protein
MPTLFSKIIQGEIPCHKIAEDEDFICFLDIHPIRRGHALVVPKVELDYIFQHSDESLAKMLPFAKKMALAIEKVVSCERVGLAVLGLEVPHTHIHLVPIMAGQLIDFSCASLGNTEELKDLAGKIRAAL